MEVGEAIAELQLLSFNVDLTEGSFSCRGGCCGQVGFIHAQEPVDPGVLKMEFAFGLFRAVDRHLHAFYIAEHPDQHIEEVHPDVGGYAPAFLGVAFPGEEIPLAAARDIAQVHLIHFVFRAMDHLLLQLLNGGVEAQLQNGIDLLAGLLFDLLQGVEVPGVAHQGLLADGVSVVSQGHADVGVVQVVGTADAHVVDLMLAPPAQLIEVAVEALGLGKEVGLREIAVDDADAIVRIERTHQVIAGFLNGFHVTWGNVTGGADEGEVFHGK